MHTSLEFRNVVPISAVSTCQSYDPLGEQLQLGAFSFSFFFGGGKENKKKHIASTYKVLEQFGDWFLLLVPEMPW